MGAVSSTRYITQAGWKDAPHLTAEMCAEMGKDIMPHLRNARMLGEPTMGAGTIYQIDLGEIMVKPFAIPPFWPRAYALDVGWNRTAAVWGALDRNTDVLYLYSEYYAGQKIPQIHAMAIKSRGAWIPGVVDPAARGRSQTDGKQLLATYGGETCGLKLVPADNAVESGLQEVWARMVSGRLKVFTSLANWRTEIQLYKRDVDGKIVKKDDHLMDTMRYLVVSGVPIMRVQEMQREGGASLIMDERAGY